ncbi:MAG: 50S ribosomal protein L23 [Dehalococcoidia bacterium]|nr:50S ribosomal protein L23 [Dehalococcoidia bacterium]
MPKELHPYDILRRPLVTEKSTVLAGQNQYVFEVAKQASKQQIKEAVQIAFSVEVKAVNVMNVRGKVRRFRRGPAAAPDWKKAVVTLQPGHKIELIEGV